jgi:cellulose synthase/poly-beta-1,6-N-acetylglucosamine synthase-like glycosyltransferase
MASASSTGPTPPSRPPPLPPRSESRHGSVSMTTPVAFWNNNNEEEKKFGPSRKNSISTNSEYISANPPVLPARPDTAPPQQNFVSPPNYTRASAGSARATATVNLNAHLPPAAGSEGASAAVAQAIIDIERPTSSKITTRSVHFDHHSPLLSSRSEYFAREPIDSEQFDGCVAVLISAFNEGASELQATLNDLYKQHQVLLGAGLKLDMHICLILDGWMKASNSMKMYMKQAYPVDESSAMGMNENSVENWQNYVKQWELENQAGVSEVVDTLILQRTIAGCKNFTIGKVIIPDNNSRTNSVEGVIPTVKLTTIIKRDNRRKHNSHEWFLCGFGPVYSLPFTANPYATPTSIAKYSANSAQLILLTDCGTRFHNSCLLVLAEYMLANPDVVAASGRNRIMSFKQQSTGENDLEFEQNLAETSESWLQSAYRSAQGFDYEASVLSFTPAFSSIASMLPVIPGPCGVFRLDLLLDQSHSMQQSRMNEEIIQLTAVSITDHQMKQSEIMKRLHTNANQYIQTKLQNIQQARDWQNIQQQLQAINQGMSNNGSSATNGQNSSPQSSEKSEMGINTNYKTISPQGEPKTSTSVASTVNTESSSPGRAQRLISPSDRLKAFSGASLLEKGLCSADVTKSGELEEAIGDLLNEILGTEMKFNQQTQLIRVYLRFVLENDELIHNKTDSFFMQQLSTLILKLTAEFDQISEQMNLLEIIMNQSKQNSAQTSSAEELLIGSQLFIRCSELLKQQVLQLDTLEEFRRLLLKLICGPEFSNDSARTKIENQMIYRVNAPANVIDALERKALESELRSARDPVEFYIRIVNKNPLEAGILLGSLLLAEDRILSYAAVLKSICAHPVRTAFVSDAIFFCQAETNAEDLLVQRRRWINGTVAGYLWLWQQCWGGQIFRNKKTGKHNGSVWMYLLFFMQLLQYGSVMIIPAIYALSLQYSWNLIWDTKNSTYFLYGYFFLYSLFVYLHSKTDSKVKLHTWLYYALAIINTFILALGITAIIQITKINDQQSGSCLYINGTMDAFQCWSLLTLIVAFLAIPFVLAIIMDVYYFLPKLLFHKKYNNLSDPTKPTQRGLQLHCLSFPSPRTLFKLSATVRMIRFAVGYFLMLPTLTMMLPVYAFCKTHELTWGNRPSATMTISNKSRGELDRIKQNIYNQSNAIAGLIWSVNFFLWILLLQVTPNDRVILVMAYILLGLPMVQMLLSGFVLIIKLLGAPFASCAQAIKMYTSKPQKKNASSTQKNPSSALPTMNYAHGVENRTGENTAMHSRRPSQLNLDDIVSPLTGDSEVAYNNNPLHDTVSQLKFDYNTFSFHPANTVQPRFNAGNFNIASPNARLQLFRAKHNYISPNTQQKFFNIQSQLASATLDKSILVH